MIIKIHEKDGGSILLNIDEILWVLPKDDGAYKSLIRCKRLDKTLYCIETPDEIYKIINKDEKVC